MYDHTTREVGTVAARPSNFKRAAFANRLAYREKQK